MKLWENASAIRKLDIPVGFTVGTLVGAASAVVTIDPIVVATGTTVVATAEQSEAGSPLQAL